MIKDPEPVYTEDNLGFIDLEEARIYVAQLVRRLEGSQPMDRKELLSLATMTKDALTDKGA